MKISQSELSANSTSEPSCSPSSSTDVTESPDCVQFLSYELFSHLPDTLKFLDVPGVEEEFADLKPEDETFDNLRLLIDLGRSTTILDKLH